MGIFLAKEICFKCKNSTKIIDYVWDFEKKTYLNIIKKIGYLCSSNFFSKKRYRRPFECIGQGCKAFEENCGQIKTIHNNTILSTKKNEK